MTTLTRSDFGQQYLVRMDAFVLLRRRASSTQIVQTSSGSQLSLSNCFWLRSILAQDISSTSWSPPGGHITRSLKLVFTSAFKLCKRMRSPDAHVKYFA